MTAGTNGLQDWLKGVAALVLTGALVMGAVMPQTTLAGPLRDDFSALAEEMAPSVVYVAAQKGAAGVPFGNNQTPQRGSPRSVGSGFVIDPTGIIVTNNHVIQGASAISVRLFDGTELPAEIFGADPESDIALLRVQTSRRLRPLRFADSLQSNVGSWVLAIGNPFGFASTVTHGIVAARNRRIQITEYDDFIQTDAAINSGNSGGPLVNLEGEVIGINTAVITPGRRQDGTGVPGLAFAIPSSFAEIIIGQILEYREARPGWLGVTIQAVTPEIAAAAGLNRAQGARVVNVTMGGPASLAGLAPNDIILTFDGRPIDMMQRLPLAVLATTIGKTVEMRVRRGRQTITLSTTVTRRPQRMRRQLSIAPREPRHFASLGVTLSELSLPLRVERGIGPDVEGLLVMDVDENSPARIRVSAGDVITSIDGASVETMDALENQMERAESRAMGAMLLKIDRKSDTLFEALEIKTADK